MAKQITNEQSDRIIDCINRLIEIMDRDWMPEAEKDRWHYKVMAQELVRGLESLEDADLVREERIQELESYISEIENELEFCRDDLADAEGRLSEYET